ncbi:ATP-binding protein [Kiloniella sp. b19]|uniref:ATP-binding protein n=1 Tax=Kiloniella sp. GXU_MW_B19 TaxID=3141326 RepID=UPI0031DF5A5C
MIYANKAFYELTGYSSDEVLGRNCNFLQQNRSDENIRQRIRWAINQKVPITTEIRNYKKNGEAFLNRLSIAPIFDEAKELIAFIGIQSDVSLERQRLGASAERQKLEALGRLSANISHEIKNALQPIFLMTDLLEDWNNLSSTEIRKCVSIIRSNADSAMNIAQNTLQFSRPLNDDVEEISVLTLAKQSLEAAQYFLEKRLNVSGKVNNLDLNDTLLISVSGFHHLLLNLMMNARDASPMDGSIEITFDGVELETIEATNLSLTPGRYLCMSVRDNGHGIPADRIGAIFDPFYTTKSVDQGTGLGLSIAKRFVNESGGVITCESEENKGSCFSAWLPLERRLVH